MNWNYLYSIVAFLIGGLAGFQGVYERYKKDSAKASVTLPGFSYLLTRAVFPAGIFAALYASQVVQTNLLVSALACGTGAELFLRSKIFIKQEQKGAGNVEDLLKGPLDLLRWYQNLLLEAASTSLAQSKKVFVDKHLDRTVEFQELCERVFKNIEAYDPPPADLKTEVEKLKDEFEKKKGAAGGDPAKLEQQYRYKLGYLVYNHVGRKGFNTLLSN